MRFGIVSVAVGLAALVGASGASAATEIGNVCEANNPFGSNITVVQLVNASSALPLEVPAAGVLTSWKVESLLNETDPERLKVLKPAAKKNEFQTVGESTQQNVVAGVNTFSTRIPVQAGERVGAYGTKTTGVLVCPGKAGDVLGIYPGNLLSTNVPEVFNEDPSTRLALSAIVEPDADGDGFGDQTQDKCPQSAAFQLECPQIGLDLFAVAGQGSATLLVIADHEAPVTVTATTKAGKGSKRQALKGGGVTLKGGTQTVVPGKFAKFKLKFTKALKSALGNLPRGKSLKLTITATATNLAGQTSGYTTVLKLKRNAAGG